MFPASHIIEYTEKSLKNLQVDSIDLQQFHVWEDGWANNDEWKKAVEKLKKEGKVKHFGVSVNRWEPDNVLKTLETGLIDTVQVIYNVFDQAPEDNLFPLCRKLDIGVIARVPFDEGTLTGMLTKDTKFPADDWRSTYFVPENLNSSVDHADALRPLIPSGMTMAEMALRFILANDDVHTIIPGMRKVRNVEANIGTKYVERDETGVLPVGRNSSMDACYHTDVSFRQRNRLSSNLIRRIMITRTMSMSVSSNIIGLWRYITPVLPCLQFLYCVVCSQASFPYVVLQVSSCNSINSCIQC